MREVLMISPTAINSSSVAGIVKELGISSRYISNPVVFHHFLNKNCNFGLYSLWRKARDLISGNVTWLGNPHLFHKNFIYN